MNKYDIIQLLEKENISYKLIEHEAVYTTDDCERFLFPDSESIAKNLFICDDRKEKYYLIMIEKHKRLDLKKLKRHLCSRRLTFADDKDLKNILGMQKGSVSPFGIWNDSQNIVTVLIDSGFQDKTIGIHPNNNTSTIWLSTDILLDLIRRQGNKAEWIKI